jgi:hypothetical protein
MLGALSKARSIAARNTRRVFQEKIANHKTGDPATA